MITLNVLLQQMNNPQHMTDGWGGNYGMGFMIFFWIVILGIIGLLIWFLIRKSSGSTHKSDDETALQILEKRYARGEIDEEEFRRKKKELNE